MILKQHPGLVFVLVGPGGVGKNALLRDILERTDNLTQLATATTRPSRDGEEHGKQRLFVTHEEFKRMIAQNELVEHEEVHTGDFYGVPRASIEDPIAADHDLIADIDMHGGRSLRAAYPNNIILIFIAPPGESTADMMKVLEKRLHTRDATDEQIEQRLRRAPEEFEFALECDYIVVNDDFNVASEALQGIIHAERGRRNLLNLRAVENLPHERFSYMAAVYSVYNGEVLCHQNGKNCLNDRLLHGELPYHAALRLLRNQLKIDATVDNLLQTHSEQMSEFISPVNVYIEGDEYRRQLVFEFVYVLNKRISAPDDWHWVSIDQAKLPAVDLLNTLRSNG